MYRQDREQLSGQFGRLLAPRGRHAPPGPCAGPRAGPGAGPRAGPGPVPADQPRLGSRDVRGAAGPGSAHLAGPSAAARQVAVPRRPGQTENRLHQAPAPQVQRYHQ